MSRTLTVSQAVMLTPDIRLLEPVASDYGGLDRWEPGEHIATRLPSGVRTVLERRV